MKEAFLICTAFLYDRDHSHERVKKHDFHIITVIVINININWSLYDSECLLKKRRLY